MEKHAEKLELSEETQGNLSKIIKDHNTAEEKIRDKRKATLAKQAVLLDQSTIEKDALTKIGEEMTAIDADGRALQIHTSIAVRALLTPDQLKEYMVIRATAEKKLAQIPDPRAQQRRPTQMRRRPGPPPQPPQEN